MPHPGWLQWTGWLLLLPVLLEKRKDICIPPVPRPLSQAPWPFQGYGEWPHREIRPFTCSLTWSCSTTAKISLDFWALGFCSSALPGMGAWERLRWRRCLVPPPGPCPSSAAGSYFPSIPLAPAVFMKALLVVFDSSHQIWCQVGFPNPTPACPVSIYSSQKYLSLNNIYMSLKNISSIYSLFMFEFCQEQRVHPCRPPGWVPFSLTRPFLAWGMLSWILTIFPATEALSLSAGGIQLSLGAESWQDQSLALQRELWGFLSPGRSWFFKCGVPLSP